MSTTVKMELEGGIAVLTFVSDGKVNSLSSETWQALDGRIAELAGNHDVRVWILTGAGKTFLAGADIKELASLEGAPDARRVCRLGQRVLDDLAGAPAVTIAAINGAALGGGCEVALACDLRLMADGAVIGQPEVLLGVIPGWGGTQRLARLIGAGRAKELVLTGKSIDAKRAEAIGLVNRVVDGAELLQSARELAGHVMAGGPQAVHAAKEAIDWGLTGSLAQGLSVESDLFSGCFVREESKEGLQAFLNKAAPPWQGK